MVGAIVQDRRMIGVLVVRNQCNDMGSLCVRQAWSSIGYVFRDSCWSVSGLLPNWRQLDAACSVSVVGLGHRSSERQ
jgi:hypothetical protein